MVKKGCMRIWCGSVRRWRGSLARQRCARSKPWRSQASPSMSTPGGGASAHVQMRLDTSASSLISSTLLRPQGSCAKSSSNTSTPKLHQSRSSPCGRRRSTSGQTYCSVPASLTTSWLSLESWVARPKSSRRTWPSRPIPTFSGLMSPCMSWREWRYVTARAISSAKRVRWTRWRRAEAIAAKRSPSQSSEQRTRASPAPSSRRA
mmetsp:Transcript_15839/g.50465  ORF Transcript_15839/g.50465 Transcript_15839/m.50465 type:complete len:205 (+) Transcript_15839:210-824(+)